MEEVIALIDKIIDEHKSMFQDLANLEQVANDTEAIIGLDEAKETHMPGRADKRESLVDLEQLLETIDKGIQAHFNREEVALLNAFEQHGDRKLTLALHSLLTEHNNLTDRLAHSKQEVATLIGGSLSRHIWEATAYDMRAYLGQTRKLFEEHAEMEQELLHTLRNELTGVPEGSE